MGWSNKGNPDPIKKRLQQALRNFRSSNWKGFAVSGLKYLFDACVHVLLIALAHFALAKFGIAA
jgi:hypothetical protein